MTILSALFLLCSSCQGVSDPDLTPVLDAAALINVHRTDESLSPLAWSDDLHRIALDYAQEMQDRDFLGETYDVLVGFTARLDAAGLVYGSASAMIAAGFSSAASAVQAWWESDDHQVQLLGIYYTEIGVGLSDDGRYWCILLTGPDAPE